MADLTFTPRRAAMALASEGLAGLDVAGLLTDPVFWGAGVPRGQGEPVLLIPGYMVGDRSLALMAGWLRRIGYATLRSGIRRNVDRTDATVALLSESLRQQAAGDPRRVAIVGQSLGGFIARALAVRHPDLVSGVITLGSPLRGPSFPHGVGFVSIYSKRDRIVDWRASRDPAARAVEVNSTHVGMGASAAAYREIARSLNQFSREENR